MKKEIAIFIGLFLIFSSISLIIVQAAGSSTVPARTDVKNETRNQTQEPTTQNCETMQLREDRIRCRLSREKSESDEEVDYERRVPEACASLRNPTACISLYKRAQTNRCYHIEGRERDRCFKRMLNVTGADLSNIPVQERAQRAREYLVLLLYDLEERVENANKEGKITTEEATEIIELITQIKTDILNNARRPQIAAKLNELKMKWRASLQ